jgi:ribose-phosphate pyrophosphokinase
VTPDLLIALPGNETQAEQLADALGCKTGALTTRKFPDGETYLRFDSAIEGKHIALVSTLNDPDAKIVPLLFAANAARMMGASKVGLCAPYLAYMRQDRSFHPGEAVTSRAMAALVSQYFDWMVTVDPHLHRYKSMAEIYTIPVTAVHAAPALSAWIAAQVKNPFLIGPDEESAQWVSETARGLGAPYATLKKIRQGDRVVTVSAPDIAAIGDRTPILLDDIISSGQTMLEVVKRLRAKGIEHPICLAVHGLFAGHSDRALTELGARIVTASSVPGPFAQIDLTGLIADGIRQTA